MSGLLALVLDGMPHGYCLLWNPRLLWLHAASDVVIALAYFLIPLSIIRFLRERRDVPFNAVFLCFGAFILLCGTTHVLAVYNIWVPNWWLSGGVKAATAGVSLATAGLLVKLLPDAIALPSPAQLRDANADLAAVNAQLRAEVAEREAAQRALAAAREQAEALVEQRTAELAAANTRLAQSEARYKAFVQASADLVWTARADGTNDDPGSLNQFLGLTPDAVDADRLAVIHPDDRAWVAASWKTAVQQASVFETEYRTEREGGGWRHVQVRAAPVLEADGAVREWLGVLADVTARAEADQQLKEVQEQLQQAQRLEAVGRLAGGIAHDFNNLLTVITGAGSLVLEELPPGHPARQDAEDVVAAGTRAAALTAQLLAYSRKQLLQPRRLDLNAVLDEVQVLLRRLIGAQVQVEVRQQPDLWPIEADPNQLEQVMLNLALNARDAMPSGGTLTFETQTTQVDDAYASTHLGVVPGDYVMLAVSDTGVGMDDRTRAQIFEPFFTTKQRGEGTGLGLATVYGIVSQSGGRIYVYSEPGLGTTFKLYFPRAIGTARADRTASALPPAAQRGRETILLVEDTEEVRLFVERVLERAGYVVRTAGGPAEALALLERDRSPIDLLLSDVIMPGMNGRELADEVVRRRPDIAVLFMSGYTDNAIVHHGVLDPRTQFLHKPFTPDQLLGEVRRVLAQHARDRDEDAGSARPA